MPASSSSPRPKPSTPMLLEMVCSPFTPRRTRAAMEFSGMPHSPKPPSITVAPGGISATAVSAVGKTLFIAKRVYPLHHLKAKPCRNHLASSVRKEPRGQSKLPLRREGGAPVTGDRRHQRVHRAHGGGHRLSRPLPFGRSGSG